MTTYEYCYDEATKKILYKKLYLSLLVMFVSLMIIAYGITPIHELGHVLGVKIIGGEVDSVKWFNSGLFDNGFVTWTDPKDFSESLSSIIVGACGGITTAFVLLSLIGLFFAIKKRVGFRIGLCREVNVWGAGILLALIMILIMEVGYSIFETLS